MRLARGGARRFVVAAAVCAGLLTGGVSEAVVLSDPASGFRIETAGTGMRECVIHPVALRVAAGCEGEDLPTAAPVSTSVTRELGMVRFLEGDRRFGMMVISTRALGQREMTRVEAQQFVDGFSRGMERTPRMRVAAGAPGSALELRNHNGRQVLRHVVTLAQVGAPGDPDRILAYHVVGRDAVVSVAFFTWAHDLPRVEARAATMAQTITMDPPRPPLLDSAAYRLGQAFGALLCVGLSVLAVALMLRFASRSSRQGAPPPFPPGAGGQGGPWQPPQGGPWQPPGGGPQGPGGGAGHW